jgi:acyl-CoA thioester hydrolase
MSIARARELRANSTDAERLLWLKLGDRRLVGAKFKRQVPFPPYTVDFCSFEAKLIVEVDGGQHAERVTEDAVRTKRLEGDGFKVIRFWNNDVLTNTAGVLEAIMTELNLRGTPTSQNFPASHLHPIRVYFEDTDAGGMVYYANYLKFAERARTEMLRAAGINHAAMVAEDGLMLVVKRCTAEYHRSARLDDELAVETRVSAMAGASILLDQVVRRGSEVLVEITVTIACVTKEGRATRLPERLRQAVGPVV